MAAHQDLCALCTERLTDQQIGRLIGWLAWRVGRAQALAGNGSNTERLAHVAEHWMSAEHCEQLRLWIVRRLSEGRPPVPD